MTGGPGCSSELAIFYEQGPYRFDSDGETVKTNAYAWNSIANVLFVDQPVGTGFSYADYDDDYVKDETGVANDMFEFLQAFYAKFPQYQKLDFFVTGESYAGHYVPAVSNRIFQALKNKEGSFDIPLKGFAIGNGLVNPLIQYGDYHKFAFDNKLITKDQFDDIDTNLVPQCTEAIKSGSWLAMYTCNSIVSSIQSEGGNFNVYDIRIPCGNSPLCYDFSPIDNLMAKTEVRNSLGVSANDHWSECDTKVHIYLEGDWMLNCEKYIPEMLNAGIRGLVYSGKDDFICNWYGGRDWVRSMDWNQKAEFDKQVDSLTPWKVNGNVAGEFATAGPLTFLAVNDAGHMVPMDQPANALDMLDRFINNKPFGEVAVSQ
jgi:serine carboxypeptidase-like clade 4